MRHIDVGGGLGVDYEGTRSRSHCSTNYGLREYARSIVRTLQEVCAEASEPEPDLISESGRALTAHHAVLIANVVDSEVIPETRLSAPAADAALRKKFEHWYLNRHAGKVFAPGGSAPQDPVHVMRVQPSARAVTRVAAMLARVLGGPRRIHGLPFAPPGRNHAGKYNPSRGGDAIADV